MKVGDVVFIERGQCRTSADLRPLTITKIGRKWVATDRPYWRFDKDSLLIDGDVCNGRIWLSRENWEAAESLGKAWRKFREDIAASFRFLPGLTLDKIAEARRVLGMGEGE